MKLKSRKELPRVEDVVISGEECCPSISKYVVGSHLVFYIFIVKMYSCICQHIFVHSGLGFLKWQYPRLSSPVTKLHILIYGRLAANVCSVK